eukprot:TRINITY_DN1184_c0_g1_i2.p1 TRINITY_DN1184_c0_g1~~TRINITY_DN1184_c0_g1_i2.p1  ORF type:complete len:515 (+),score=76.86 TRINITY_DN1184_c0_g1_i2:341-1885(+)
MRLWFWFLLLATTVASLACLWFTPLPLGITDEWTWKRITIEPDLCWNLVGVAVAAALYVAFIEAGTRQLQKGAIPSRKLTIWLIGLVGAAFTWLWVVQESSPMVNRLGKSAFVLYYSSSSGYFTKARYENPDPRKFLSEYEELMREGDVLHVGTHPPGLFLVFHGLISLCHHASWLECLDATQPASFREACDVITRNSVRSTPLRPLLPNDRRVLWLATLLVMGSASLTVVPLFALLRRSVDSASAWRGAALWPAIPAVAIFIPKSDVAYAFVGSLMVLAWLAATERRSITLAVLTGLLVWLGLMMSLAFLPVVLFMAILSWKPCPTNDHSVSDTATWLARWIICLPPGRCLVSAMIGFAIPTLLLGWIGGINLIAVWRLNYINHAGFYAKYTRTYWMWLLENPLELAVSAGCPVFILALLYVGTTLRTRRITQLPLVVGVMFVWGALWLTGKNSGEVARLWIVFLPWLVWLAGLKLAEFNNATGRWLRPATVILAVQLAACALTVVRVSGFEQ